MANARSEYAWIIASFGHTGGLDLTFCFSEIECLRKLEKFTSDDPDLKKYSVLPPSPVSDYLQGLDYEFDGESLTLKTTTT